MSGFVWRQGLALASAVVIASFALASSANAESVRKQCSQKYQSAKSANTLNGQKWNQFYKQCAAELKGTSPKSTAAPAAAPQAAPAPAERTTTRKTHPASPAPMATGHVVFPRTVDTKYANLSAGKARLKTCLDQYHANKANNSNGGLRWIEKGGGYYSECNKHLKGE
ncbi:MAG: hypothetical protein EPN75_06285 [Beijerinckiaceae bacterium]|nr:MAG: hypothetical protein EPN75_06285 [Beijerinckiaceae bacterium]